MKRAADASLPVFSDDSRTMAKVGTAVFLRADLPILRFDRLERIRS